MKLCLIVFLLTKLMLSESYYLKNSTYNILILTSPVASRSHSIFFNGIAMQLASLGHKVTHRCAGQVDNIEGIQNYVMTGDHHPEQFMADVAFDGDSFKGFIKAAWKIVTVVVDAINVTYNEPLISDLVQQPTNTFTGRPKYDVVLVDEFFGEMFLPLVRHLKVPSILVASSVLMSPYAWNLNVPYNYLFNYNGLPEPMDIFARTRTFIFHFYLHCFSQIYFLPKQDAETRMFIPNSKPLTSLMSDVSFTMTGNPPSIQDSVPTTPNVMDIGCVHCKAANRLPQDLEDVMQQSGEHGVIYFSMGSFVKSEWIPEELMGKIITVLSKLPQTILWKGQLNVKNLTNFYVREWFPQQDLLAHPKLRLVINNGGLGTMQEVTYHGCPILGFPLNVDHNYAMKIVKKNGYGEHLEWRTFTSDDFFKTVTRILTNKTYKEAAMRASIRMRDALDSPSARAAFWTEYIIRHRGAPFLKSEAHHLRWYQYFLLDVIALIAITVTIVVSLTWYLVKCGFIMTKYWLKKLI